MSLFPPTDADHAHFREVGELFVSGAMLLQVMLSQNESTTFDQWVYKLCEQIGLKEGVATDARLRWLWDALRTHPELKQRFGALPPAAAPWSSTNERFKVFDPGEWFVIGLKRSAISDLLKHPHKSPEEEAVAVKTLDALFMKAGKGERLECCDCHAEVTIQVPEVFSLGREADVMEIQEDRIAFTSDHRVVVRVDSLNQAYTVASRRLEPTRRSHGGRTYDHVVHVRQGKRTPLEAIRQSVENGGWSVPTAASPPTSRKE